MIFEIKKAERKKAKLKIGLSGPSGSGKTYSALLLARGFMSGKLDEVVVIDTENESAHIYEDLGDYKVLNLRPPYSPERCIEAIKYCENAGYKVIIFDSATHEWIGEGGCLELNQLLANAKYKGNTWTAWNETTPRHRRFLDAIISSDAHIITTMRSKTETIMTDDKKVKKVGMKDEQREGFEYELFLTFNLDKDTNTALVDKNRTPLFKNTDPFVITEQTGMELRAWAESGATPIAVEKPQLPTTEEIEGIRARLKALDTSSIGKATAWLGNKKIAKIDNATKAQLDELDAFIKPLEAIQKAKAEENTTND